jgi:hypothetical protein
MKVRGCAENVWCWTMSEHRHPALTKLLRSYAGGAVISPQFLGIVADTHEGPAPHWDTFTLFTPCLHASREYRNNVSSDVHRP